MKELLGQLDKPGRLLAGCTFILCYEASHIGYRLQRELAEKGYPCDVVAPTSILTTRGKPVKTDRVDAVRLAQCYANGLLSFVSSPGSKLEQDRDLVRSHQKLLQQRMELHNHIQALLHRRGLNYKVQT